MATFEEQIEGLTGLTISSTRTFPIQSQVTQYLKDAVIDVTNKCIALDPSEMESFSRESSEQTSNGFNPGTTEIVAVLRESGTNNDWYPCRKEHIALQSRVKDVDSLHYASKFNPVYMITQNRNVHVYPEPSADGNDTFKVLYVNRDPEESDGTDLQYDSTGIKWFPDDKVYLVVLYAACKSIMKKLASIENNLPVDLVPPVLDSESLSIPEYTAPGQFIKPPAPAGVDISFGTLTSLETFSQPVVSLDDITISDLNISSTPPVVSSIESSTVSITGTAPTYAPPVLSLDSSPTVSDLNITAVAPVAPSISEASVDTSGITDSTYTAPIMHAPDWGDTDNWIASEEDSEMLASRIQEINSKINEYSARIAESTAKFNQESERLQKELKIALQNSELSESKEGRELQKYQLETQLYQANVNKEIQQYQANFQKEIQLWESKRQTDLQEYQLNIQNNLNTFNKENTEYQAKLQKDMQDAQLNDAEEAKKLQKYSNEIQTYQTNIQKEVEEYANNFQKDFQIWQAKRSTNLEKYNIEINKESAKVQSALNNYQAEVAKAVQTYQSETGFDLSLYEREVQANVQEYNNDLAHNTATFTNNLQRFTSDVQAVSQSNQEKIAKYNGEIQNYAAKTSITQLKYEWLQGRHELLMRDYNQAFQIMAPRREPQQQREG
tara:strand:- start:3087 stop:5093 length:2007 start_codon:yes stop_codon:yes gene_type:complete